MVVIIVFLMVMVRTLTRFVQIRPLQTLTCDPARSEQVGSLGIGGPLWFDPVGAIPLPDGDGAVRPCGLDSAGHRGSTLWVRFHCGDVVWFGPVGSIPYLPDMWLQRRVTPAIAAELVGGSTGQLPSALTLSFAHIIVCFAGALVVVLAV